MAATVIYSAIIGLGCDGAELHRLSQSIETETVIDANALQ